MEIITLNKGKFIRNIILLFFPIICFGQNHSGTYFGMAKNDTIGKIEITLELNQDSTYVITAQFDYIGEYEGLCYDGQTWKYYGTWLSYKEFIFFKPCENDEHLADGTYKCKCCEFPNADFDFETLTEPFKSEEDELVYLGARNKINQPFQDLGYTHRLTVKAETQEIYFHFGWDCHELIWSYNPIKKIK